MSELADVAAQADLLAQDGSERELADLRAKWGDDLEASARSADFRAASSVSRSRRSASASESVADVEALMRIGRSANSFASGSAVTMTAAAPSAMGEESSRLMGEAIIFANNGRPVAGSRGHYRVTMRHGIIEVAVFHHHLRLEKAGLRPLELRRVVARPVVADANLAFIAPVANVRQPGVMLVLSARCGSSLPRSFHIEAAGGGNLLTIGTKAGVLC